MSPMASHPTKRFTLEGLDCANCAAKIESAVQRETGLTDVGINFATRSVYLPPEYAPKVQQIIDEVEPGVKLVDADPVDHDDHAHHHDHGGFDRRRVVEIVLATALLIVGVVFQVQLQQTPYSIAEYGVFLAAYLLVGRGVIGASISNIRRGDLFDENFLMTIATIGAFLIHELPEAVAVMLFYSVGEAFQDLAVNRSRRSIKALMDIRPDYANVQRNGETLRISPEQVGVGEMILVRPGEKIPLDGEVIEGSSYIDTSALTGESVPRRVEPGEAVLAGTVNTQGLLTLRVTKAYGESSVAKILDLVENAGARKAKTEKFITTFSRYYTPAVVFIALGVAILPPLFVTGATFSEWTYRALVLLVISCPCALVLSIPLGYFGGIGGAARQGILVKGANFLDALTHLDTVVMDKTGTVTEGVFKVSQVATLNGSSEAEVLDYAAHAESFSSHPIATSIREAYGREVDAARVADYRETAGHGVTATIDGKRVVAGNDRILHVEGIPHDDCTAEGTVVNVAVDGTQIGRISIGDEIKPDAAEGVASLKRLGVRRTVMLTGDNREVAEEIARSIGIDEVYAQLLPEDKVTVLERLAAEKTRSRGSIAFVGDGINDAPVLTRADVGIAMGGLGSDAAIEAADVVVMDDKPSKIATAVKVARRTRRIVLQNIAFALGVKAVVMLMGTVGLASMWEAVFADVGVSLIAVLNATRALRV